MMLQYNDVEIEEFFAKIPYCSDYLVSNKGNIFSLKNNKFLKPYYHNKRYPRIELKCDDGSVKKFFIHRLVVDVFGDKNMNREILPGYDIDHLDRNKLNNSINNLEIITHKENMNRWQKKEKRNDNAN